MKKLTLFVFLVAICTWAAFAGGYQVRLQGQKQTGMGLVGSPFALGASSIFYNPGGLSFMETKFSFSVGVSGIMSNAIFQKDATNYQARTDNPLSTPFYIYGAGKINDKLSIGLGIYTPFGSTAKWADDWAGRYLIQNISLSAIYIQPTISYKFNDIISVGAGFVYAYGKVEMNKAVFFNENSTAELSGTTGNIGYNIGVMVRPIEKLSIGIDYRSKIMMNIEGGDATFKVPESLSTTIPENNKFDASLPMPANLDIGIAYAFNEKFTLSAELNYVMWSVYEDLTFTFEKQNDLLGSVNPRKYKDTFIGRIGGQYTLNDMFTFRAGAYYDPSPTNDDYFNPETVSLNTVAWTLGISIVPVKNLSIDLSYLQLHGLEAEKSYVPDNFSGTYKVITAIPGLGVSYNF
ncbi:MAG: outer membrane protein transport protein [Bacteroidales bacterium]|nr:outer membrane protein transport protein [Bacteroidales bacterium]